MGQRQRDAYQNALRIAESLVTQAEDALKQAKKNKVGSAIRKAEADLKDAQERLKQLKGAKGGEARAAAVEAVMEEVYQQLGGFVEELLRRVPEIASIVTEAIESGLSVDEFVDKVQQSEWWTTQVQEKGREDSWFQAFRDEYGGNATAASWNASISDARKAVAAQFARYGVNFEDLSEEQQYSLARKFVYEDWKNDPDEIERAVNDIVRRRTTDGNPREGQFDLDIGPGTELGQVIQTLRNRASAFGLTPNEDFLREQAMLLIQEAQTQPVTMADVDAIFARRAERTYGLGEGVIGFDTGATDTEGQPTFRTLKDAVYQAIMQGGEAARNLLSNQRVMGFLDTWKDNNGVTFRELLDRELEVDRETVVRIARGFDLGLSSAEIDYWASEARYNNWSQQQLSQALYSRQQSGVSPVPEDPTVPGEGAPPVGDTEGGGTRESLADDVRKLLRDYGIYDLGDAWVMSYVERMVNPDPMQSLTIDDVRNIVVDLAKERYGPLGDRIDSTRSTRTAATNYLGRMASLLELDPDSIELNDPLLEKYLTEPNPDTPLNLADFSKAVRSDKRWQFTENARDTYMDAVQGFLSRMGFTG